MPTTTRKPHPLTVAHLRQSLAAARRLAARAESMAESNAAAGRPAAASWWRGCAASYREQETRLVMRGARS